MLELLAALAVGLLLGYVAPPGRSLHRAAPRLLNAGIVVLLFAMGVSMGTDETVLANLGEIGLQAFAVATGSILGSVALVAAISGRLPPFETSAAGAFDDADGDSRALTAIILASLVAGVVVGRVALPAGALPLVDRVTAVALDVLLFSVGVSLAGSVALVDQVRTLGWTLLVIPASIAAGSIVGALGAGVAVGLTGNEAAAVGAGFGWYSFSAVLLTQLHSVELGSLAFLANVFREVLTLVTLPLVVRHFGTAAAIAPGGATTMDVTLPVVKETAGTEAVLPAFVSGAVLSSLVPFLVPLLVSL
ncbi:lysine exporter LysO family protein [Halobacteriaceae archaeon GCM10025711]